MELEDLDASGNFCSLAHIWPTAHANCSDWITTVGAAAAGRATAARAIAACVTDACVTTGLAAKEGCDGGGGRGALSSLGSGHC